MEKSLSNASILFRKEELKKKFLEALKIKDGNCLSSLEVRWVHRYGLSNIPSKEFVEELITSSIDDNFTASKVIFKDVDSIERNFLYEENLTENHQQDQLQKFTLEEKPYFAEQSEVHEIDKDMTFLQDKVEQDLDIDKTYLAVNAPPPPKPNIKHLRRWLPKENILPEAS